MAIFFFFVFVVFRGGILPIVHSTAPAMANCTGSWLITTKKTKKKDTAIENTAGAGVYAAGARSHTKPETRQITRPHVMPRATRYTARSSSLRL